VAVAWFTPRQRARSRAARPARRNGNRPKFASASCFRGESSRNPPTVTRRYQVHRANRSWGEGKGEKPCGWNRVCRCAVFAAAPCLPLRRQECQGPQAVLDNP
jgi:hypothetical protein